MLTSTLSSFSRVDAVIAFLRFVNMKYSTALCGIALAAVAQAADCIPVYKNPNATVEDRVNDLLRRMTVEEKTSQLIQGDIRDYLDLETGRVNQTGLEWVMERRSHAIWTGLYAEPEVLKEGARIAQEYLTQETRLGSVPAHFRLPFGLG